MSSAQKVSSVSTGTAVSSSLPRAATSSSSSSSSSSSKLPLYLAAIAIRLVLCLVFPNLPDLLTSRVEISTPVTSFKRLQEGLFLYNHNVSPYDGGVFHQAPLLLPLFSLLPDARAYPLFTTLLFIAVDILSADALARIADSGEAGASKLFQSPRRAKRWTGLAVATAFLFSPFTIATCLGRSSAMFTTCAILHAIANAIAGTPFSAMAALAVASYLSMYPALLLPPLLLLAFDRQRPGAASFCGSFAAFAARHVAVFCGWGGILLAASMAAVAGSGWGFVARTYGVHLTLGDLTPNVGLWWYFFVEMFDSFRAFFLAVFWLHLVSYVGALAVRMRPQPLAALVVLIGLISIFKPYPSAADASLFFALLPLLRHLVPLMRYAFVAAAAVLYATFLGPAFYHLWIFAGSGNANFFYAITLVWSLGLSLIVSDLTFAVLRDEWEVERPEMVGKEVRQL